jgi:hypothetical protein
MIQTISLELLHKVLVMRRAGFRMAATWQHNYGKSLLSFVTGDCVLR